MKTQTLLITLVALVISFSAFSQKRINVGGAYYGEKLPANGGFIEVEMEKFMSTDFSLPLRTNAGYFVTPDYNTFFIDFQKGFRKYFESGFFCEQAIGIGLAANYYTLESIWFLDEYQSVLCYKDGANWGLMPSVTLGLGYNLTHKKGVQNNIWVRPKVYWNLGVRGLNLPYSSLQIGFTHTLKTSKS